MGTYGNDMLLIFAENNGLEFENIFGIRTFFAMSTNFEKKIPMNGIRICLNLKCKLVILMSTRTFHFFII